MIVNSVPIWKKAPFLRLLLPLILGILWQYSFQAGLIQIVSLSCGVTAAILLFTLLPIALRFKLQVVQGFFINLIVFIAGLLLTYQKDIRHHAVWFGNFYQQGDYVTATINEPPVEKNKSFKAEATVDYLLKQGTAAPAVGRVILYFLKDTPVAGIKYGDKVLFNKKLLAIQNSGNPGAFDYKKYLEHKQIFHNVFLKREDWVLLPDKNIDRFRQFLYSSKQNILAVLYKNMQGKDDQLAIAEALLIGYTQDLDKDLVQAYSNTGVVHIIAISGMHLGLIYIMLVWIFNRVPFLKNIKILRIVLILSCLWLFALLTGGGASILRSAVMFSCIVIGENFSKKASIYNSIAASAFILLCVNPFYIWDVGFQLSYLALCGIVIFQKPIYHLIFIKNKMLDKVWNLTAVSLAAQILTFPVCLYYFHQFPTIFLVTNLLTVPLSGAILFVEIFLVAFAWVPQIAFWLGKLTWWLIWIMNTIIAFFNTLPYALWDGIAASLSTTLWLYIFICGAAFWLLYKSRAALRLSLVALFAFTFSGAFNKWSIARQQKMIVYNVSKHQAIDFIRGSQYTFVGDSMMMADAMLNSFHLKPGRTAMQLHPAGERSGMLFQQDGFFKFLDHTVLIIDSAIAFKPLLQKMDIDIIIISKNPKLSISQLAGIFNCGQYVFDASNSLWRTENWKRDCTQLNLPFYSVAEKGAFIKDL